MITCESIVESYLSWLRETIHVSRVGDACEITTPFLDRHNDHLQLYVVPTEGGVRVTDDGYILSDLRASGCAVETKNRKRLLSEILNGFGVHRDGDDLFVDTTLKNLPQKKHALIQAMLAVNDMFMTARHQVSRLFLEDVVAYLEAHHVRYAQSVEFTGRTGFTHKFDFLIPRSQSAPERLGRAINNPSKDAVASVLFTWTDIREVRGANTELLVFLNDAEREVTPELLTALGEYGAKPVEWSKRDQVLAQLVA